jgi:hypothetical protein
VFTHRHLAISTRIRRLEYFTFKDGDQEIDVHTSAKVRYIHSVLPYILKAKNLACTVLHSPTAEGLKLLAFLVHRIVATTYLTPQHPKKPNPLVYEACVKD